MPHSGEYALDAEALARSFHSIWDTASRRSVNTSFRARFAFRLLLHTLHGNLSGDVAECGVYRGGFAYMLAKTLALAGSSKRVHLFDSFTGLPEIGELDRAWYRRGQFGETRRLRARVQRLFQSEGLSSRVEFHVGWFTDTFPALPANVLFCFIHFDGDLQSSTRECFEHLYPRLVPGGVLILDDFFTVATGLREAVREHVARTGELLFAGPEEAVCLIKGRTRRPDDDRWLLDSETTDGFSVSMEAIAQDRDYFRSNLESGAQRLTIPVIEHQIEQLSQKLSGFRTMLRYHHAALAWSQRASEQAPGAGDTAGPGTSDTASTFARTGWHIELEKPRVEVSRAKGSWLSKLMNGASSLRERVGGSSRT